MKLRYPDENTAHNQLIQYSTGHAVSGPHAGAGSPEASTAAAPQARAGKRGPGSAQEEDPGGCLAGVPRVFSAWPGDRPHQPLAPRPLPVDEGGVEREEGRRGAFWPADSSSTPTTRICLIPKQGSVSNTPNAKTGC